jgi:nucleoid-associated protein YgaU
MSLISFIQNAGEKLFNQAQPATAASPAKATPDLATLNATAAAAVQKYIGSQGLKVDNLAVKYDASSKTVTVDGVAADQATKEKVVLCCGNVNSVAHVDDRMTVATAGQTSATFREVKSGDSLSKIAKEVYGDANAFSKIFEANRPMLSDPNKIYPGQMLRIPAA